MATSSAACTEILSAAERISAAPKINEREIKLTVRKKAGNSLAAQKLAGAAALLFSIIGLALGGDFSAAAVIIPPALAAVFSKEKLLDFGIFKG